VQRPIGVTILALFDFLGMVVLLLGGLLLAVGMGVAGMSKEVAGGMGAILAGVGIFGAVFCFILAVLYGVLGWGLWSLKNWARIITVVFAGIGLAFGALGLVMSLIHFEIFSLFLQAVPVAVNALIVWYMLQPHVKQAFGA
jgi:uncharacterized membrane protein (DUF2068 family)